MTSEQRIAELEAKLAEVQAKENSGVDTELLAKAKERAKMSWSDITWALKDLGAVEALELTREDVELLRDRLIQRKYESLLNASSDTNILAF